MMVMQVVRIGSWPLRRGCAACTAGMHVRKTGMGCARPMHGCLPVGHLLHMRVLALPLPLLLVILAFAPCHLPVALLQLLLLLPLVALPLALLSFSQRPLPLFVLVHHARVPLAFTPATPSVKTPHAHPASAIRLRARIPVRHHMDGRHRASAIHAHAALHAACMVARHVARWRRRPRSHAALPKIRVVREQLVSAAAATRTARRHRAHLVLAGVAVVRARPHGHSGSMRRRREAAAGPGKIGVCVHAIARASGRRAARERAAWPWGRVLVSHTCRSGARSERRQDVVIRLIAHAMKLRVRVHNRARRRGAHGRLGPLHRRRDAVRYHTRPGHARSAHRRAIALELWRIVWRLRKLLLMLLVAPILKKEIEVALDIGGGER
jgi:hypothetical protein